jgi:glycerol-3-phosphate dehydrogenase
MALDVMGEASTWLPDRETGANDRIFGEHGLSGRDVLPEDPGRGERLLGRYGDAAADLIREAPHEERPAIEGTRTCMAQLRWALSRECVVHLDDLMLRRTRLGLLLEHGGSAILDEVRDMTAELLGWSPDQWRMELGRYREIIRRYYAVP